MAIIDSSYIYGAIDRKKSREIKGEDGIGVIPLLTSTAAGVMFLSHLFSPDYLSEGSVNCTCCPPLYLTLLNMFFWMRQLVFP